MQKHHTARRKYTILDGIAVPIVSGGADDGDGDDADGDDDEDGDDEGDDDKKSKSFTEERVQRIAAREYRRGQKKGVTDLLKELEISDADELKRLIARGKGQKVEESEELKQEREALRKEREKIDRERSEAAEDRFNARVERRLVAAGAKPSKIEKIARLLDLDLADDPDKDDIDEAIATLEEEMPELFVAKDTDDDDEDDDTPSRRQRSRVPDGDPGRPKGKKTPKGSGDERGRAKLMERHPELAKN